MAKRLNHRLIKTLRTYTIEELADLLGCHKNTVRLWIKRGLPTLGDGKRPLLVHGEDARDFLQRRRAGLKRKCGPDEMLCFGCKEARRPAFGIADFKLPSGNVGMLSGLCEVCSTLMFKRTSVATLERLSQILDVRILEADGRLSGSALPFSNCHLAKEC